MWGDYYAQPLKDFENRPLFAIYAEALDLTKHLHEFKNKEAKIGTTINIRKPPRYLGRSGAVLQLENSTEQYTQLTLTNREGCDIVFDSQDLALTIDDHAISGKVGRQE